MNVQRKSKAAATPKHMGHVRIIAGEWRGRLIPVASAHGLRPTGNRTRETLFNWLQGVIPGSRCLDLFAGSGALGFEAASRGAARVMLVESQSVLVQQLNQQCQRFAAGERVQVCLADARRVLRSDLVVQQPWDVVFVDPPWVSAWHNEILGLLHDVFQRGGLSTQAKIYVESPQDYPLSVPAAWQTLRHKCIGQAQVHLLAPKLKSAGDTVSIEAKVGPDR